MPQDPLPELNSQQARLWDEIQNTVSGLKNLSKLHPETFVIAPEAIHPFTVYLPQKLDDIKELLRKLGELLSEAEKDEVLSRYSFVQRHHNLIERVGKI